MGAMHTHGGPRAAGNRRAAGRTPAMDTRGRDTGSTHGVGTQGRDTCGRGWGGYSRGAGSTMLGCFILRPMPRPPPPTPRPPREEFIGGVRRTAGGSIAGAAARLPCDTMRPSYTGCAQWMRWHAQEGHHVGEVVVPLVGVAERVAAQHLHRRRPVGTAGQARDMDRPCAALQRTQPHPLLRRCCACSSSSSSGSPCLLCEPTGMMRSRGQRPSCSALLPTNRVNSGPKRGQQTGLHQHRAVSSYLQRNAVAHRLQTTGQLSRGAWVN